MSPFIENELALFLRALKFGVSMALFYDLFRILRRIVRHSLLGVSLEDLLFWFVCGLKLFGILYEYNNGTLRFYMIIGAGIGALCYHLTLSRVLVKYIAAACNRVKIFFRNILEKCAEKMEKPGRMVAAKAEASQIRIRNRKSALLRHLKKKLTTLRKMIKIVLCKH